MKIKNNTADIIIETLCLVLLIGIALYLCIRWSSIPDKVPMHYDWNGNIDRWGGKMELLILPVSTWLLYLFITAVEHFPKSWNTGVVVTEENKKRVYRTLKYLIKSTKLLGVVDFSFMTIYTILGKNLPGWFTLVFLTLFFGDMFFWIVKLVRVK